MLSVYVGLRRDCYVTISLMRSPKTADDKLYLSWERGRNTFQTFIIPNDNKVVIWTLLTRDGC